MHIKGAAKLYHGKSDAYKNHPNTIDYFIAFKLILKGYLLIVPPQIICNIILTVLRRKLNPPTFKPSKNPHKPLVRRVGRAELRNTHEKEMETCSLVWERELFSFIYDSYTSIFLQLYYKKRKKEKKEE